MRDRHLLAGLVLALLAGAAAPAAAAEPTPTSELLHRDIVVGADLWDSKPRMLAAGLGFTNILGVPGLSTDDPAGSEARARAAGGAWNTLPCTPAQLGAYTSAVTPEMLATTFGHPATFADGLPVEFSWPIRPSTLDATDFRVTLNDGTTVTPELASVYPNQEYNERAVTVLVGHFGNRTGVYAVKTTVVRDATPLQLIGPGGRPVSAVGLSASATSSPYGEGGTGPRLAAAKLTRMSTRGEGAPRVLSAALPNDGVSLYGDAAKFRLRVFTTGGFSPDGVRGVLPTEFSRYFRLRTRGVRITRTGVDYHVGGGTVRVLGLADLGRKQATYDDCYQEDHDNQIDIVLAGDASAVSRITGVEIPAGGAYSAFHNPGGPGNAPTPHVPYTAAGPAQVQPVTQALEDPMTVTFHGDERHVEPDAAVNATADF